MVDDAVSQREVLKDIWLAFYPGAKIGVLGRNGSGKSTLLNLLGDTALTEAAADELAKRLPDGVDAFVTPEVKAVPLAHALSVREPYGVWGGFSESERLRLLALGWEDLADRRGGRVDVQRLEARLGRPHKSTVPAQRRPESAAAA